MLRLRAGISFPWSTVMNFEFHCSLFFPTITATVSFFSRASDLTRPPILPSYRFHVHNTLSHFCFHAKHRVILGRGSLGFFVIQSRIFNVLSEIIFAISLFIACKVTFPSINWLFWSIPINNIRY